MPLTTKPGSSIGVTIKRWGAPLPRVTITSPRLSATGWREAIPVRIRSASWFSYPGTAGVSTKSRRISGHAPDSLCDCNAFAGLWPLAGRGQKIENSNRKRAAAGNRELGILGTSKRQSAGRDRILCLESVTTETIRIMCSGEQHQGY